MYNTLLRLYKEGRLSDEKLHNAVLKGWISEEQEAEIKASKKATA